MPEKITSVNSDTENVKTYIINIKQNGKKAQNKLTPLLLPKEQKILTLLQENKKPMTVTDIYINLKREQSVASQKLAILKKSWVVKQENQWRFHYYSLNKENIEKIKNALDKYISQEKMSSTPAKTKKSGGDSLKKNNDNDFPEDTNAKNHGDHDQE